MKVYVIGGGPAGMLSSILIKRKRPDFEVTIIERNDRVGKKLLGTGNGRCNYTNLNVSKENFHSDNDKFPMKIIERCDNEKTIEILKTLGIYPISEENGKVFPLSLQGSSVLDLLRIEMDRLGVKIIYNEKIDSVEKRKNFKLKGKKIYDADIVIIATGGLAMPSSGSDGIGYRIAKELGHEIIAQTPTIVQLESNYKYMKSLKGVRVNSKASLYIDDDNVSEKYGDILFTDYGLSGPAILDLSRSAIKALIDGKKVEIGVNLVGIPDEEVYSMIEKRASDLYGMEFEKFLIGVVNKKCIHSIKNMLECRYNVEIGNITSEAFFLKAVCDVLTDFRFCVSGYRGYGSAQATTGGVDTRDVREDSLESKKVDSLYFVGEVLDVDGDCGGYNLQWAWSSAYVAAESVARKGKL